MTMVATEPIYAEHPRTGDRIVNVRDNALGVRATLITRDGHKIVLAGTWVFAPELSFTVLDVITADKAGVPSGYVLIGSAWQY